MIDKIHLLLDVAPFSGSPVAFCPAWQDVMKYFEQYDQRILEHKVHVLRGSLGLEAKAIVTIRPKLVFVRNEVIVPSPDVPLVARVELAKKISHWSDEIIDSAMLTAGIDPSRGGSVCHPSVTIFYEPRVLAACDSVNPQQKENEQ